CCDGIEFKESEPQNDVKNALPISADQAGNPFDAALLASMPDCALLRDADGLRWLFQRYRPADAQLFLFGAGHVGAAVVRILADLPCRVHWIDQRAELFEAFSSTALPENVTIDICDAPEMLIAQAPPQSDFLVMTHSHALDQLLSRCILARESIGWFGLIGSRTKRIQFERRLLAQGIAATRLSAMTCPIGIDGIDGKQPGVIAVAVVAQLLQVWERRQTGQIPAAEADLLLEARSR
ncbi:MAG: xanthine dehydrogenase accessory protein XdhC, partial [Pseudomonadota bacterium]|nr:xanthine dehydrogenase accessory protein XdhC [Pseudomonadota bacterium]